MAIFFAAAGTAVFAIPKAAEHEDAPVTTGSDVARPRLSTHSAKAPVSGKTRSAVKGKAPHTAKHAKLRAATTRK